MACLAARTHLSCRRQSKSLQCHKTAFYSVRHESSGQNVADSLSRVMKVPLSPCDGSTKEYIGMITVDITPGAMITRQIERASAEDKEQQKCIAVGRQETGVLLLIRTDCCVMKVL